MSRGEKKNNKKNKCVQAKKTGDYTKMVQFYGTAFQNFANLCAVFKLDPDQVFGCFCEN